MTKTKRCSKCNKNKTLDCFHKNRTNKDGLCYRCKECRKNDRKKYYNKDKEREYYQKNKERIRKRTNNYKKHRYNNNPKIKIDQKMHSLIRIAIKKNRLDWKSPVGYTAKELKEHLEKQFKGWMDWNNWGRPSSDKKTWQIDHIRPKNNFNYDSYEDDEFKECWSLDNLRPRDSMDNCSS